MSEDQEKSGTRGLERFDPVYAGMGDLQRAIRQRWPMSREAAKLAVDKLLDRLAVDITTRDLTRVVRTLALLDQLNMEQEKRDQGIAEKIEVEVSGEITHRDLIQETRKRVAAAGVEEEFLELARRMGENQ